MASTFEADPGRLLEAIGNDAALDPDWDTPEEAGRLSLERFIEDGTLGRSMASHGIVRLVDEAAGSTAAALDAVGSLMRALQQVVSAIGSSLEGSTRSVRGPLPSHIRYLTQLDLAASPAPGSVILDVSPRRPPSDELYPDGQVPMSSDDEQLVDRAVSSLVDALTYGADDDPGAPDSSFIELLTGLGPRTAGALHRFMEPLAGDGLDMDLDWAVPGRASRRARVTSEVASRIMSLVAVQDLDEDETVLVGRLNTISSTRAWDLETDDGEVLRLAAGDLPIDEYNSFTVGTRVEVRARVVPRRRVGGDESYSYTALTVRRVGGG